MSENTGQAFEVKEKLAALEVAMLEDTPTMPTLLRDIHRQLKSDDTLVTLLSEEEIAILVNGLKQQTRTVIATKAVKKGGTKAMSKITVDDL